MHCTEGAGNISKIASGNLILNLNVMLKIVTNFFSFQHPDPCYSSPWSSAASSR